MSELSAETKQRIGPALGKIPSGIYVTTAVAADGNRFGMLASFIEQAGFAPPTVMIAIGNDRPMLTTIREGEGNFGINVLSKENGQLVAAFAKPKEGDAFAELKLSENKFGLPQLADALAFLACRFKGAIDAGDHTVVVAEVLDGVLQNAEAQPMIRVRSNGFGY